MSIIPLRLLKYHDKSAAKWDALLLENILDCMGWPKDSFKNAKFLLNSHRSHLTSAIFFVLCYV